MNTAPASVAVTLPVTVPSLSVASAKPPAQVTAAAVTSTVPVVKGASPASAAAATVTASVASAPRSPAKPSVSVARVALSRFTLDTLRLLIGGAVTSVNWASWSVSA